MSIASDYVAHGMALVSIRAGKNPRSLGWNKLENVITDPEQASALTNNIGLAHAYCSPPTMALDIDELPRAMSWLAAHGIDLDELLNAVDSVQIVSGRAGRAKLLYRLPAGVGPIQSYTLKQKTDGGADLTVLESRCRVAGIL
jgi:hypothetical protein